MNELYAPLHMISVCCDSNGFPQVIAQSRFSFVCSVLSLLSISDSTRPRATGEVDGATRLPRYLKGFTAAGAYQIHFGQFLLFLAGEAGAGDAQQVTPSPADLQTNTTCPTLSCPDPPATPVTTMNCPPPMPTTPPTIRPCPALPPTTPCPPTTTSISLTTTTTETLKILTVAPRVIPRRCPDCNLVCGECPPAGPCHNIKEPAPLGGSDPVEEAGGLSGPLTFLEVVAGLLGLGWIFRLCVRTIYVWRRRGPLAAFEAVLGGIQDQVAETDAAPPAGNAGAHLRVVYSHGQRRGSGGSHDGVRPTVAIQGVGHGGT